jgi:hypothetical protein
MECILPEEEEKELKQRIKRKSAEEYKRLRSKMKRMKIIKRKGSRGSPSSSDTASEEDLMNMEKQRRHSMKRKYIQMERIKDDSNSAYTLGNEALTIISNCVDYITLNSSLINQQIIRNFAAQILEVLLYQVVINQV